MELGIFIPIGNNGWLISTTSDITDPYGKLMERAGGVRDGGAFWDRMGNIAVWNSVMDEDRYLTRVERVHHHVTTFTRPAAPLPRLLSPALPRRRVRSWLVSWLQVSPLAFILIVLFAMPTFLFAVVSFFDYDRTGIYPAFILDNYRDLLTTPATIRVYVSSLTFAVIVWAITLFLGLNIAHFLIFHVHSAAVRTVLFLLCAIPFWTSGIIRTIAWIPFLGRNGAFNQIVMGARLTSEPVDFLLFSRFAVVITYVNLFTLLVVGPIANSLAKIDPALIEAARDAGASRWRVMVEVIIPLSKTGIALGSILVFTQVMGDFFVVKQMSGGQSASIVSALATEIQAMQYPPASASAVVLVCFVAILFAGMMRVVDVRKELVK